MKKWLVVLLLLCLCGTAAAELVIDEDDQATLTDLSPELSRPTCLVDLTLDPDAEWAFAPGVPVLEIVFPQVNAADACILRIGGHVMMIDAGGETEEEAVRSALTWMGVTRVETGLTTHPHHDHMPGFSILAQYVQLDRVLNAFKPGTSGTLDRETARLAEMGIPLEPVASGDVLTIAGVGEKVYVFQKTFDGASVNERSLMTLVTYGERSILLMADVEKDTQKRLITEQPDCGISADILKYPHHGIVRMLNALVEQIRPRLAVITADAKQGSRGAARMAEYFVPVKFTPDGAIRLRTDGVIWVLDRLPDEVQLPQESLE